MNELIELAKRILADPHCKDWDEEIEEILNKIQDTKAKHYQILSLEYWCKCGKWKYGYDHLVGHHNMTHCPFCGKEFVKTEEIEHAK